MSTVILSTLAPVSHPEPDAIAAARLDANNAITYLTFPDVAAKFGKTEHAALSFMFRALANSCTPATSVGEIDQLMTYVRKTVGEVSP